MATRPRILGIVNITADSFSDGGRYLAPQDAIAHGRRLFAGGADILDLGPASSHPDAAPVAAEEEIARLAPVIDAFADRLDSLSIDSFLPETQRYAIARGVGFLNDIHGFADSSIYPLIAGADCRLVVMHMVQERGRATRASIPPDEMWERIETFLARRIAALEAAGIARERLILDPGMGFFLSSRPEASTQVLAHIERLRRAFGLPLLISVSRKSFLRGLVGREVADLGPATLAAELFAAACGVDYIRTHDAAALSDGLRVTEALRAAAAEPLPSGVPAR